MAYTTIKTKEILGQIARSSEPITIGGPAPGTQAAGKVAIGQKDSSVGSTATLDIETEEDVVVIGTFTASHKIAVWINGVEYHISLDAV